VVWNALGGVCWATAIGLLAYFLGNSAGNVIETFGIYGLVAAVGAVLSAIVLHRRARRKDASARPRDSADAPDPVSARQPEGK